MKLLLILASAITLAAAGSRSYRESHHSSRHSRDSERERRANLDYDDIETADQEHVEHFDDQSERSDRKSSRIGAYTHTLQVSKSKQSGRRHSKSSLKDSEASGTHFEGAHFGTYGAPQVQQIHTHELLTSQGLVPLYQTHHHHGGAAPATGNIVLTGGIGVTGLGDAGAHHHHQTPLILHGAGGHPPAQLIHGHPTAQLLHGNPTAQLLHGNPGAVAAGPVAVGPEPDLGTDITKSVYVFSAPPDPFDFVPRQTISKVPHQRPQKHYQVLFINAPSPPPAPQHHVELPPAPSLKTLVYVLVKKPPPPPPINFIKGPAGSHHKPEVYFIRYKNRGFGLSPSPVGPIEDTLPVGHPGVQYAPIGPQLQEEIRGNIDYGPGLPANFGTPEHHPYELNDYQDDAHVAASQVLSQRGTNREVDAGVAGI